MKIAYFSDNFYPEISGMTDAILLLGKELINRGHDILYVAPKYPKSAFERGNFGYRELDQGPHAQAFRIPSIPFRSSPTGQSAIAFPFGWSLPTLKRFKPDIIHVHSPFGAGLEGLYAAKLLGFPMVGTNHTPIAEFMKYTPIHTGFSTYVAEKWYVTFYNRCRFVSAPSQVILDDMAKQGLVRSRRAISNPLNVTDFNPVDEAKKNELKKKHGVGFPTLIYTGRLAEEKKIDLTIEAVARLAVDIPDIRLIITGYGKAEQKLRALVASKGIDKNVLFTGFVPTATLVELYQAADIFVIMSTAETQCLSLMQAMATGLPSIVARSWALPEYVRDNRGLVVDAGDVAGLSAAIRKLIDVPGLRAEMGVRARDFVRTLASPIIAEQWDKIYENIRHNPRS
jgi:glycosyltransferase involved in cell wall biosynthesis